MNKDDENKDILLTQSNNLATAYHHPAMPIKVEKI